MGKKRRELEEKKLLVEKRKKKRKTLYTYIAICCCITGLFFAIYLLKNPAVVSIDPTWNENGDMLIEKSLLTGDLSYVSYTDDDTLLVALDEDGQGKVAFDTCEECYASGSAHFTQNSQLLVCATCQVSFPFENLGQATWGGCQPVAIPVDYREDTQTHIVIPREVLDFADNMFQEWDMAQYEITMENYGVDVLGWEIPETVSGEDLINELPEVE